MDAETATDKKVWEVLRKIKARHLLAPNKPSLMFHFGFNPKTLDMPEPDEEQMILEQIQEAGAIKIIDQDVDVMLLGGDDYQQEIKDLDPYD